MNSGPREGEQYVRAAVLALALFAVSACSKSSSDGPGGPAPNTAQPTVTAPQVADAGLTSLFSHIWRMSNAPSQPAPGSIYIFLPNGTLLETSCVETYRVATWTVEKKFPRQLKVVEDRQLAFLANIEELTDKTLHLKKELVRSKETQEVTLDAVDGEFVCPDLRK